MFSQKILMMFFSFGLLFFSVSLRAESSMMEIVNGVKELCGGKGHGSEISIVGNAGASTSKAVSLMVNGNLSGTVNFTSAEWDGVEAVRHDSKSYTKCVSELTPIFIDKFSKKK